MCRTVDSTVTCAVMVKNRKRERANARHGAQWPQKAFYIYAMLRWGAGRTWPSDIIARAGPASEDRRAKMRPGCRKKALHRGPACPFCRLSVRSPRRKIGRSEQKHKKELDRGMAVLVNVGREAARVPTLRPTFSARAAIGRRRFGPGADVSARGAANSKWLHLRHAFKSHRCATST